jgi:hypothetical protein
MMIQGAMARGARPYVVKTSAATDLVKGDGVCCDWEEICESAPPRWRLRCLLRNKVGSVWELRVCGRRLLVFESRISIRFRRSTQNFAVSGWTCDINESGLGTFLAVNLLSIGELVPWREQEV